MTTLQNFCCALLCCRRPAYYSPNNKSPVEDATGEADGAELNALRENYRGASDDALLGRIAELERANADLRMRLAADAAAAADHPTTPNGGGGDDHSSSTLAAGNNRTFDRDEIVSALKSQIETLKEEKAQAEMKLEWETQKSRRRKEEASRRRSAFKGKLADMSKSIVEDKLRRSYPGGEKR